MAKITTTIVDITPEMAQHALETQSYEHQRRIDPKRVAFYAEQMKQGKWQPTSAVGMATPNGKDSYVIIDGNHTLSAVVKSGVTLRDYEVKYFDCDGEKEVADLYAYSDVGKPRGYVDSLRVYGVEDATGLSIAELRRLTSAVFYLTNGFPIRNRRTLMDPQDTIALIQKWVAHWKAFDAAIRPSQLAQKLQNVATAGVALVTFRHAEPEAEKFWSAVATGEMMKRNDPRMAFHKAMLTWEVSSRTSTAPVEVGVFARGAVWAWNKWRRGGKLTYLKPSHLAGLSDLRIQGTPYSCK